MAKTFLVAAEKEALTTGGDQEFSFSDSDRVLVAHPPGSGQIAVLMARMGRHSTMNDKIAGVIDFFVDVLGDSDRDYVVSRLLDANDTLGIEEVTNVMQWLMEEWSGRPTK